MTTIRTEGLSSIVTSEADVVAQMLAELEQTNERCEREAMRDDREEARTRGEEAIGKMREAANLQLAAGLVSGGVKVASAVGTAANAASTAAAPRDTAGPAGGGSEGAGASEAATEASDDAANAAATAEPHDFYADFNRTLEGTGESVEALLRWGGSEADARAERLRNAATEARGRSEEARDDAAASARFQDKIHEVHAQVVAERRRAEEAATRA